MTFALLLSAALLQMPAAAAAPPQPPATAAPAAAAPAAATATPATTAPATAASTPAAAAAEPAAAAPAPPPVRVDRVAVPEKALRFEVDVPASVADTWTALTTTAGVETWLWKDARVDLRSGGDWLVLYPGGKTGGGTVVSFRANRRLELAAMAPEWFPTVRRERTRAVFELQPLGPASTRVTLVQTGWKEGKEWDDAYDYLAKGNAQLLDQLRRRFATGPLDWSKAE